VAAACLNSDLSRSVEICSFHDVWIVVIVPLVVLLLRLFVVSSLWREFIVLERVVMLAVFFFSFSFLWWPGFEPQTLLSLFAVAGGQ